MIKAEAMTPNDYNKSPKIWIIAALAIKFYDSACYSSFSSDESADASNFVTSGVSSISFE